MSLYISSINSGSNGNCYYIGNEHEAVLIDAGISCREIEKRMLRNGLNMSKIKAVFISHEHSDHIRGLEVLSRKYKLPVYISPDTLKGSALALDKFNTYSISCSEPVVIGDLKIIPFSKFHDAADPYSFSIEFMGIKIGVFTDLGLVCDKLINHFGSCHAAFLESNYDEDMLANSPYPYFLKRRISGGKGHLSNSQALQLFIEHRPEYMQCLLLSHLSKNNNNPSLVESLFKEHAGNIVVSIASRDQESEVYRITADAENLNTIHNRPQQTVLFQ